MSRKEITQGFQWVVHGVKDLARYTFLQHFDKTWENLWYSEVWLMDDQENIIYRNIIFIAEFRLFIP